MNSGYNAKVPGDQVTQDDWTGVGYVFWKDQGCACYLLQGSLGGGMTTPGGDPFVWGSWYNFYTCMTDEWQEYYPEVGFDPENPLPCSWLYTRAHMLHPPDSSIWAWGESVPYVRIDSVWQVVDGERDSFQLGPDTCWFNTREYEPNLYIFRPEVYGPYPPDSPTDTLWYLSDDSLSIWVFDVRVDQELSTRYVALPPDEGEDLSEPARTYFEIRPSNFLSGVGARVEEIQHLVRAPDSTTIVYGPVVLDRAVLESSGGEGMAEWNGKNNEGEYVEAQEADYRSKIAVHYYPTEETRQAESSELKMKGRDGNSEKALRFDIRYLRVTNGYIVGIADQPSGCQDNPPVLHEGHFDGDGHFVVDRSCQAGFEIRDVGSENLLSMKIASVFEAWPVRPELGSDELSCEVRWEIDGIGDGRLNTEVVANDEWVRDVLIEVDCGEEPSAEAFGSKIMYLFYDLMLGGKRLAMIPIGAQLRVYFEKGTWDDVFQHWVDYDNDVEPNWFEYWELHDCVYPEMGRIKYWPGVCEGPEYGHFNQQTGEIIVCPGVATESDGYTAGGVTFPGKKGIDMCAETIAHELVHEEVWLNNHGGIWDGLVDTDGDNLPDDFEVSVVGTDPTNRDTYDMAGLFGYPDYWYYGDEEYYCRVRAVTVYGSDPSNDWANPGKQTDPPF